MTGHARHVTCPSGCLKAVVKNSLPGIRLERRGEEIEEEEEEVTEEKKKKIKKRRELSSKFQSRSRAVYFPRGRVREELRPLTRLCAAPAVSALCNRIKILRLRVLPVVRRDRPEFRRSVRGGLARTSGIAPELPPSIPPPPYCRKRSDSVLVLGRRPIRSRFSRGE